MEALPQPSEGIPPSAPLYQRIAQGFNGNRYTFLMLMLRSPGASQASLAESMGLKPDTISDWKQEVPGFADMLAELRTFNADLRSEYAQAAFRDAVPGVVDAMVNRATGNSHKDAQRAGERILEAVGVLRKEGDLAPGTEAVDILMLKLRRRAGST